MSERRDVQCPHCGSGDVQSELFGFSVDTYPPIYYDDYQCANCAQSFTVKWDEEHGVRAVLKDFVPGHYYPDDDRPPQGGT